MYVGVDVVLGAFISGRTIINTINKREKKKKPEKKEVQHTSPEHKYILPPICIVIKYGNRIYEFGGDPVSVDVPSCEC